MSQGKYSTFFSTPGGMMLAVGASVVAFVSAIAVPVTLANIASDAHKAQVTAAHDVACGKLPAPQIAACINPPPPPPTVTTASAPVVAVPNNEQQFVAKCQALVNQQQRDFVQNEQDNNNTNPPDLGAAFGQCLSGAKDILPFAS